MAGRRSTGVTASAPETEAAPSEGATRQHEAHVAKVLNRRGLDKPEVRWVALCFGDALAGLAGSKLVGLWLAPSVSTVKLTAKMLKRLSGRERGRPGIAGSNDDVFRQSRLVVL
jgi:hypothetical protein